ncbi:hypothetical protein VTI74DRAFT_5690 [Chaetomium olivicolor]
MADISSVTASEAIICQIITSTTHHPSSEEVSTIIVTGLFSVTCVSATRRRHDLSSFVSKRSHRRSSTAGMSDYTTTHISIIPAIITLRPFSLPPSTDTVPHVSRASHRPLSGEGQRTGTRSRYLLHFDTSCAKWHSIAWHGNSTTANRCALSVSSFSCLFRNAPSALSRPPFITNIFRCSSSLHGDSVPQFGFGMALACMGESCLCSLAAHMAPGIYIITSPHLKILRYAARSRPDGVMD